MVRSILFIFISFILLSVININTVGAVIFSPQLRCVTVDPATGDVTLTWVKPPDPANEFKSYHIFSSPTGVAGTFIQIGSVTTYATESFVHVGSAANFNSVYYFVQTENVSNVMSPVINTLQTIYLSVTPLKSGGVASLSWNSPQTPKLATTSSTYNIYREFPAGSWNLLNTTNATTYNDTISICNATLKYRITLTDARPCISESNVGGGSFIDNTEPKIPLIDSVSVNPVTGLAVIGWTASSSQDTKGYEIDKQQVGGSYTTIATINGINNTSYTNPSSNASFASETYRIRALDSCGNASPYTFAANIQNTIHATVSLELCDAINIIRWNKYNNMSQGTLNGYKVFYSVNGGPYSLLSVTGADDDSLTHPSLIQNSTYCYTVTAFNNLKTITASSNSTCIYVKLPSQPVFSYLRNVTVTGLSSVEITAFVDDTADVQSYEVHRGTGPAQLFKIATIPFAGNSLVTYTDNDAAPSLLNYYYKIIAIDSCGEPSLETNFGRTIFLTATADNEMNNILSWNSYEDWDGGVLSYNIYRSNDGGETFTLIDNINANSYVDNVFNTPGTGNFSYYVEALQGFPVEYTFQEQSRSNVVEVVQHPVVYVPNAFTPEGTYNKTFRPKGSFIKDEDYLFVVFDRWGKIVFETRRPADGWDGTIDGTIANSAMYIYSLKYQVEPGVIEQKHGSVFLLR